MRSISYILLKKEGMLVDARALDKVLGFYSQEIWLILPVVICLFQGLSHANARVLAFYAEKSVYGSLNGLSSAQRRSALCSSDGITISKWIANTCKKYLAPFKHWLGFPRLVWCGVQFAGTKINALGQLTLLTQANVAKAPFLERCWTNLPPIRLKVV